MESKKPKLKASLCRGRRLSWPVLLLGLLFFSACGRLVSIDKNPEFTQLEEKVIELDVQTREEIAQLRKEINTLQGRSGSPASGGTASGGYTKSTGQASALYRRGRDLFVRRNFEGAARVFEQILATAPRDKLAPNARYWLGECYYSRSFFREALVEFQQVLKDYPTSGKAPDAMLKIAYSHHMLGDGGAAMLSLRDLLRKYPKSHAAGMVRKGQTVFRNP